VHPRRAPLRLEAREVVMSRISLLAAALLSLLFAPGFVCASRVERVEGEVDALRIQFEEIQQRINDDQAEVTEMLLRVDREMDKLEEVTQRIDKLTKGGLLDLQVELDKQQKELAQLRGEIERKAREIDQNKRELQAVVKTLGMSGGVVVQLPEGADELHAFSQKAYDASRWDEAIAGFQEFATRHGGDERVPDALFKLANAHFQAGNYGESQRIVQQLIQGYPDEKKTINPAILLLGKAAEKNGDFSTACVAYDTLAEASAGSLSREAKRAHRALGSKCD